MSINTVLRSAKFAWLAGAVLLGGLSAFAYSLVGWIGIGVIGLFGLLISTNLALGSDDVPMYAKRLEEAQKSPSSPEQKMAAAVEHANQSRMRYSINTVFVGMTAFGFGLFILHQL